jgi:hypothetical protein
MRTLTEWIKNGDFETGDLEPWKSRYPDQPDMVKVVDDDGLVLHIEPASQACWQSFPATTPPGRDVTVQFWARNMGQSPSLLNVFLSTSSEGIFMGDQVLLSPEWQYFVVWIPLSGLIGGRSSALYFAIPPGDGSIAAHIDNVDMVVGQGKSGLTNTARLFTSM